MTLVLVATASRLACHLSLPEIASQIARSPTTGAFHSKQADHASLHLDRSGILHNGHTANDTCTRGWLRVGCFGSRKRHNLRLNPSDLCPRGNGLRHEFIPNASW